MDLSLENLVIFVSAAGEKSFSATARRLGKAQSAVSNAISDLEIDLGVTLFDRDGHYPVLTQAGAALLAEAEAILSHCSSLKERAGALTRDSEPRITLGIEDAFPFEKIAGTLGTLHRDYPEVQIEMKHPCNRDLVTQVMKGEVMLGLGCTRAHYPQGLAFCRLGHVTFVNAAHKDHPLSQLPNVRFAQLADHLQLILSDQVTHLLTTEYLKSAQRWHVHSQGTLIEILKNGIGWAIVPKRLIAGELASGELVELKLQSYPVTDWTIGLDLIWSVESKPGRVTAWLKSEIMRTKVFV